LKKLVNDLGISFISGCLWFCAVFYMCEFLGYEVIPLKIFALTFFFIAFRNTFERLNEEEK